MGVWRFGQRFGGGARQGLALAILPVALCLLFGLTSVSFAQKTAKPGRKVILQVKTQYPEILKDLHFGGQVRLTATVLPNGTVASVKVRGGNPILAENAVKAVKNWKYAPAPSQTEEEVVLDFSDRSDRY
jgi:TonB family protein